MRRDSVTAEAAATLNKRIALFGVQTMRLDASRVAFVENAEPAMHLTLDEVRWTRRGKAVFGLYGVQVNVKAGETLLAECSVAAQATYVLKEEPTDEQLRALPDFLGVAGWLHVWPYLRAEVSAMTLKLGPPLVMVTLPMLLAGQTKQIAVTEEPSAAAFAPAEAPQAED